MNDRSCPRCGQSVPEWQPIHFQCLFDRMKYWILGLLIMALIMITSLMLLTGEYNSSETTIEGEDVEISITKTLASLSPVPFSTSTSPVDTATSVQPTLTAVIMNLPSSTPDHLPLSTRLPIRTPPPMPTRIPLSEIVGVNKIEVTYDAFTNGSFDTDTDQWDLREDRIDRVVLDGQDALLVNSIGYWEGIHVQRKGYPVNSNGGAFFRFSLADSNHAGRFGLMHNEDGFAGLIFHNNTIYPDYSLGGEGVGLYLMSIPQKPDIKYIAEIIVDLEGRVTWQVWEEIEPGKYIEQIHYTLNSTTTNEFFKDGSYNFFLHAGTDAKKSGLYLLDYQEVVVTE